MSLNVDSSSTLQTKWGAKIVQTGFRMFSMKLSGVSTGSINFTRELISFSIRLRTIGIIAVSRFLITTMQTTAGERTAIDRFISRTANRRALVNGRAAQLASRTSRDARRRRWRWRIEFGKTI